MSIEALNYANTLKVGNTTRKYILTRLADRADERFSCFPSVGLLAAEAEISERQVQKHLAALREAGFVSDKERKRADRSQTTSRYFLHGPWDQYGGTGAPFPQIETPKQARSTMWEQPPAEGDFRDGTAAARALDPNRNETAGQGGGEPQDTPGEPENADNDQSETAGQEGVNSTTPPPVNSTTPLESTRSTLTIEPSVDAAPSARSAADARRASTGSSVRASVGGSAASGGAKAPTKLPRRLSSYEAREIRAIEEAYPSELRALLPKYRPAVVRDAMLDALALGTPHCRTGAELGARVDRRWWTWHFAREVEETVGGKGLKSPVGALVKMLRHTDCPNPRCEDGTVIDTGERCEACVQRKAERRAKHRAGREVPAPRPARPVEPIEPMWECSDCRAPARGNAPEDGLCRDCRTEAASAAQVVAALEARWSREREEAERAGWLKLLEEAYAAHADFETRRVEREEAARVAAEREKDEAEERALLRAQIAAEHPELLQYAQPASPALR